RSKFPYSAATMKRMYPAAVAEVNLAWENDERVPIKYMTPGTLPGGKTGYISPFTGKSIGPKPGFYTKKTAIDAGFNQMDWDKTTSYEMDSENKESTTSDLDIDNMSIDDMRTLLRKLGGE
ncbi:MAG: hypothetical protein ACTSUP_00305, partial [Candidatus Heimdallarchaeaceae archaeon]